LRSKVGRYSSAPHRRFPARRIQKLTDALPEDGANQDVVIKDNHLNGPQLFCAGTTPCNRPKRPLHYTGKGRSQALGIAL
jgi:hypothetical protein